MKVSKDRMNECRERLLSLLNPGDTVYGVVRSVSRSGMSRRIDFYCIEDGELRWLTPFIGDLCGYSHSYEKSGLRVDGCGMDMIFAVVYDLGRKLWPDGFGLRCDACGWRPQSKEQAEAADSTQPGSKRTSCPVASPFIHKFYGRNGWRLGWDTDGGYALKHGQI